jgi:hypothetical protein
MLLLEMLLAHNLGIVEELPKVSDAYPRIWNLGTMLLKLLN